MNKKQEETNLGRPPSYYYCTWVLNVRHVAQRSAQKVS